jgi:MFS family permease
MRTFGALGYRGFVLIWTANTIALVGIATFDAACAWLMTSLNPEPLMVSLVQTATVLPMFLLTLVGGALADVVRPRRFLIANSALIAVMVAAFAAIVSSERATSGSLLATIFVLSGAWALNAPAWLAIVPGVAPPEELESAMAASGLGYNLSRLVGPSMFALATAILGVAAPFWLFCGCNLVAVALLLARRAPQPAGARLPPERVWRALGVGVRHAVHNRRLHAPLVRAVLFFAFASAASALLPLVARRAVARPEFYGVALSALALGSVLGSLAFVSLKDRLGLDRVAVLGAGFMAAALLLFGASPGAPVVLAASLVAGAGGILVLTSLTVAVQQVLPNWVRGRGLAVLLTVVFGSVSLSSAGWGKLASADDPSHALLAAAAGLLLTIPLAAPWRLGGGQAADLEPSLHYRRIALARTIGDNEGPVLVTVRYCVGPDERAAFLEAIEEIGHERRRDGAARWGVYEDIEENGRFVETFSFGSLADLRRYRERVTMADRKVERRIEAMLQEPRTVRFHAAPSRKPQAASAGRAE